jgi:triosephosphate isomerase (TIM)
LNFLEIRFIILFLKILEGDQVQAESVRATKVIGNWKMHKTIAEAKAFVTNLGFVAVNSSVQIGLAVPFTMISTSAEAARGTLIAIGAQNVSEHSEGPYTGEISCQMLKDAGASFVIIGHSERRRLFGETDATINQKVKKALTAHLQVVLCIGETLEEQQQGKTEEQLKKQLAQDLSDVTQEDMRMITLAYEPVWAIGTGRTATPEMVQRVQQFCRAQVAQKWGKQVADHLIIQYGGSVTPQNAAALLDEPDVDGLLVGGAALAFESFIKVIQSQQIKVS